MAEEPLVIDVADAPELQRVLEQARERHVSVVVRDGDRDVATVTLAPSEPSITETAAFKALTQDQQEWLLATAGSMHDLIDVDAWIAEIYASRGQRERAADDWA